MTDTAVPFEDLHPGFDAHGYYIAPNEEPLIYREFLKYRRIERAAAICSGGEVGFFGLLPLVRRELILIDHSYRSLSIAMLKWLMLREKGWQETYRLLSKRERRPELPALVEELKVQLPEKVLKKFNTIPGAICSTHGMPHIDIIKAWEPVTPYVLKRVEAKLDKIRFIHGDLTDLAALGQFDVVYMSNAVEHTGGRTKEHIPTSKLTPMIRPGGFLTGALYHRVLDDIEVLISRKGSRTYWTYALYRVDHQTEVLAA